MASEAERHLRERLGRLRSLPILRGSRVSGDVERLQKQLDRMQAEPSEEEIWRSVELARHSQRPYTLDYVERLFEDFVELHGDRARAEDPALVTGLGRFGGRTVAIIGQQKGRDIDERTRRNFGMPHPEGYRKGMRVMEIAQRHGFPLVTFLDSPGAYPGVAAEQHGQGGAIARSQALMARMTVPLVTCIVGEGNSGGAIAIGLVDRILMQENAMYSVISPEGCAAILWRDGAEKVKAAVALKPDAAHCLELGVVDEIVPEPQGGAHLNPDEAARILGEALGRNLDELAGMAGDDLRRLRRERYRRLGVYAGASAEPALQPGSCAFSTASDAPISTASTVFSPACRCVEADSKSRPRTLTPWCRDKFFRTYEPCFSSVCVRAAEVETSTACFSRRRAR
jgi:acetyl-CoA carboxylase carboxyl transferase subunit alpha